MIVHRFEPTRRQLEGNLRMERPVEREAERPVQVVRADAVPLVRKAIHNVPRVCALQLLAEREARANFAEGLRAI